MFQDIRTVTTLFNDITPTVSKYWEGPGMPSASPLSSIGEGLLNTLPLRWRPVPACVSSLSLTLCPVYASPGSRDVDLHQLRDRVLLVRRR